uniref:Myoglobin n=1 Tax=Heterodontus portusjacksoni TaxID=7793 RepID=MYG_HETPO|nr:RecName: Full=Myoglobin [Heterodontus portusjacksoni]
MTEWEHVNKVWAVVEPDIPAVGLAILLRLFKEHKETKDLFPKFKEIPVQQLGNNEDLRKHGVTVLRALGNILKQKGKHSTNVKELADTHINKHKIPPKNFVLITNIAVKVLTEMYPSDMTGPMQESFSKVFTVICSDLETLYKEANFQG